jgi:hypothetical protein
MGAHGRHTVARVGSVMTSSADAPSTLSTRISPWCPWVTISWLIATLRYEVYARKIAASEKFPNEKPRIISDNGPQFIAKDFKEFIRITAARYLPGLQRSGAALHAIFRACKGTEPLPTPSSRPVTKRRRSAGYVRRPQGSGAALRAIPRARKEAAQLRTPSSRRARKRSRSVRHFPRV